MGRKTTEVKCNYLHIISRVHTVNGIYHCWSWPCDHLVEIVFVGFIHCKLTLFSPFHHCTLWKDVTTCSPHLRWGELCTTSLRVEHLHKLFGILLHWRFVYSPAFIYLLNDLFISLWTHRYLFYTFVTNPIHILANCWPGQLFFLFVCFVLF